MAFYTGPFLPLVDIYGAPLTSIDFCDPESGNSSATIYGPGASYPYNAAQAYQSICADLGGVQMLLLHHVTTIYTEGSAGSTKYPENQYVNNGVNYHYKEDPYQNPETYIVHHNYSHYNNNAGWTLIVSNIVWNVNHWTYDFIKSESRWYFIEVYDTPSNVCPTGTVYNDLTKTCDVLPGWVWDNFLSIYIPEYPLPILDPGTPGLSHPPTYPPDEFGGCPPCYIYDATLELCVYNPLEAGCENLPVDCVPTGGCSGIPIENTVLPITGECRILINECEITEV